MFLELGRNYVSIITTIINNITVSWSHNVTCFDYFMPMNQCISKKVPPIVSHRTSPVPGFHQVCLLFYKKYFINLFLLWSDYCKKKCIFKVKQFFLSTCCCLVLILLFCGCVFLRTLFHSSTIIKLRIASNLHIRIASYLASYQIMLEVDTTYVMLSYLYHFGNVNKLFRYF